MNDKFMDEYDTELVNRTMMESLKDEGYEAGLSEGKTIGINERTVEIAKNMIEKTDDVKFISECTGLSNEELEKLKND